MAAAAALVGNVYHDDTTEQHNDHPLSSLLDITPAIDVGMPNNNSLQQQQQQQYNGGVGGRMMMNHPSIMSNDNKNTLHFTPHNFHQAITIHYPTPLTTDDYATRANTFSYNSNINNNNNTTNSSSSSNLISLPVCTKCKKNYKTRDICRMKLEHTDVPWTNSYICITLHESCVGVDGQYVVAANNDDKESGGIYTVVVSPEHNDSVQQQKQPPFQQQQPQQQQQQSQKKKKRQQYQVQTHFDSKTPVCSACKLSKRTMTYCRKKMHHKDLPWNTLYVMLKLRHPPPPPSSVELSSTDEAVGVNNAVDWKQSSQQQEKKRKVRQQKQEEKEQAQNKKNDLNDEFDINYIAPSRTFLAVISSEENSIRWLTRVPDKDGDDDGSNESEQSQQNDFMSNPSFQPQSAQGDDPVFGSQVMNDDDASSSLAVDTKKKKRKRSPTTATKKATTGRRKTAATTKPTIATTKKKQKKLTKRDRKRKEENNNKRLALEAIAYAKEQARKERLQQQQQQTMLHQFVRVPQPPPSLLLPQQQQQQEQQLLLPQQYQLLGTEQIGNVDEDNNNGEVAPAAEAAAVEEHLEKVNTEIDNEEDDDKMTMLGVNDSDNLDGDDILTEAAKLMEWL